MLKKKPKITKLMIQTWHLSTTGSAWLKVYRKQMIKKDDKMNGMKFINTEQTMRCDLKYTRNGHCLSK